MNQKSQTLTVTIEIDGTEVSSHHEYSADKEVSQESLLQSAFKSCIQKEGWIEEQAKEMRKQRR